MTLPFWIALRKIAPADPASPTNTCSHTFGWVKYSRQPVRLGAVLAAFEWQGLPPRGGGAAMLPWERGAIRATRPHGQLTKRSGSHSSRARGTEAT